MKFGTAAILLIVTLGACSSRAPAREATSGGLNSSTVSSLPHYTLRAKVQPVRQLLAARVEINFPAAPAGTVDNLILGRTYTISRAQSSNGAVVVEPTERPFRGLQGVRLTRANDGPTTLTLEYEGPLSAFVNPPMNLVTPELIELSVDSYWIPYPARLGSLFTIEGTLDGIPGGATVVTNIPSRRTTTGIQIPRGAPTGDVALVAAANFKSARDGRFVFFARDLETQLAKAYRKHGDGSLRMLESLLGRLPTGQAAVAIVQRKSNSGYSRPGYIIVTETANIPPERGTAKFIAHELAHAWFSRAPFDTEEYWLVETPAEYLGLRYVEATFGLAARDSMLASKRPSAETAGAILGRGRTPSAAIYSKGPVLLFDLERQIGRDAVDRVFRELARLPVHSTPAFFQVLTDVAGKEVATELETRMRAP